MPKKNWIDFKELRGTLDFGEVLRAYGVELKVKNEEQLGGFCPLPGHGGNKKSESFSVNVKRKIFNCFGCAGHFHGVFHWHGCMNQCKPFFASMSSRSIAIIVLS